MGFDKDLNKALENAQAETVKFLAEQRKISVDEAKKLMPKVSDCRVTQVVDILKGVHCMNPKDVKATLKEERPTEETPKYLVSARRGPDLDKMMDEASWNMLDILEKKKGLTRLDAYSLASITMDCRVGGMDGNDKSVHCVVPKSLWVAQR